MAHEQNIWPRSLRYPRNMAYAQNRSCLGTAHLLVAQLQNADWIAATYQSLDPTASESPESTLMLGTSANAATPRMLGSGAVWLLTTP